MSRVVALILAGLLLVYVVLLGRTGVELVLSGEPVVVVLGLAVLIFPVLGVWVVWRELRFGFTTAAMDREFGPEGRDHADAAHVAELLEVAQKDSEWHSWFALALAYDDAGDRRQARRAMSHATVLFRDDQRATPAP